MQDDESGIYAQPDVSGGTIPESPQLYSEIEWREEFLGDVVYDKPPVILVGQHAVIFTLSMLHSISARFQPGFSPSFTVLIWLHSLSDTLAAHHKTPCYAGS